MDRKTCSECQTKVFSFGCQIFFCSVSLVAALQTAVTNITEIKLRSDKHRRYACNDCLMKISGATERLGRGSSGAQVIIIQQQVAPGTPPPPAAGPGLALPPGWEQRIDPASGRPYFVNPATGASQWDPPVVSSPLLPPPPPSMSGSPAVALRSSGSGSSSPSLSRGASTDDYPEEMVRIFGSIFERVVGWLVLLTHSLSLSLPPHPPPLPLSSLRSIRLKAAKCKPPTLPSLITWARCNNWTVCFASACSSKPNARRRCASVFKVSRMSFNLTAPRKTR